MHGDDLKGEDVLPAVVADLEDGALPGVVFLLPHARATFLDVNQLILRLQVVCVGRVARPPNLEGRHKGGLVVQVALADA